MFGMGTVMVQGLEVGTTDLIINRERVQDLRGDGIPGPFWPYPSY